MSGKAIARSVALSVLVAGAAVGAQAIAAGPPQAYEVMLKKYPAPALEQVQGREYKFLIDPAQTKPKLEDAFVDIWEQVKLAAERRGFKITEKDKDAFRVEVSTKEYLDTADQALWKAGYLITSRASIQNRVLLKLNLVIHILLLH